MVSKFTKPFNIRYKLNGKEEEKTIFAKEVPESLSAEEVREFLVWTLKKSIKYDSRFDTIEDIKVEGIDF